MLFMLLEFKQDYFYHEIEILVDNATTHTAKAFKIYEFRKGNLNFTLNPRRRIKTQIVLLRVRLSMSSRYFRMGR